MECLTDRLRPTKINQFTISTPTPTPDSFQPNTFDYSLQSPKSSQPLISYPTFPSIPTIATLPSSSVPPLPLPLPVPVPYSKTSNIQTYIRFKPFTKNQLMSFNCDTFPMNQSNNSAIGINIIDDKNITVELSQGNNNNISNNNNNNNSSQNSVYQSQQSQQSISSKLYTFDHIFGPQTSQVLSSIIFYRKMCMKIQVKNQYAVLSMGTMGLSLLMGRLAVGRLIQCSGI